MEIWAHRGRISPQKIGNSIQDFMYCYDLGQRGLNGFEADVVYTADKKAIVYHPRSNLPDLAKMTWREIEESIFNVLTLYSFLCSLKSYSKIPCCLDIKQNSEQLIEEVVDTIALKMLWDRVFITAFQNKINIPPFIHTESGGELLQLAKKLDPAIKTHLIAVFPFNLPAVADKYKPDIISFGWLPEINISKLFFKLLVAPTTNLNNQVKELHDRGIKVIAGILNDTDEMKYFSKFGIDGIMTDDPKLGISFKERLNANG